MNELKAIEHGDILVFSFAHQGDAGDFAAGIDAKAQGLKSTGAGIAVN